MSAQPPSTSEWQVNGWNFNLERTVLLGVKISTALRNVPRREWLEKSASLRKQSTNILTMYYMEIIFHRTCEDWSSSKFVSVIWQRITNRFSLCFVTCGDGKNKSLHKVQCTPAKAYCLSFIWKARGSAHWAVFLFSVLDRSRYCIFKVREKGSSQNCAAI